LALVSFHIHLAEDILGSRGPEGYQWPIPYLEPFSSSLQLMWRGQWMLNSWQNYVITLAFLLVTFWLAWYRGFSPLEMLSEKADAAFVAALRARFESPIS
jgi:inner membrane protein